MLLEQLKNNSFSKLYRIHDKKGPKFLKIYKKNKYFDLNCPLSLTTHKKNLNTLFKNKLTVGHQIISNQILILDTIKDHKHPNINNFFSINLKKFSISLKKLQKLKKLKGIISLNDKISLSLKILSNEYALKQLKINSQKVKNYIGAYEQNTICHGDLHFNNIFTNKTNCIFIDWDYCTISTAGFDLAMLSYLENFNKKQLEILATSNNIKFKEIEHYLPICVLLDFLYQLQISKISRKPLNFKPYDKLKSFLPYIT